MERNDRVDSPAPVLRRAPRVFQLVAKPTSAVPNSNVVVEPRLPGRLIKDVLFVDPSIELQRTVQNVLGSRVTVHGCSTFEDACSRLISHPPDVLVTSVRLHAHNGLHLVYLAARNPRTRSIVHLTVDDFALAREVEAAGAFVVREPWLVVAIESLVFATLPSSDRRDVGTADRRRSPRGGRRCTDAQLDYGRKLTSSSNPRLN
jgi:hypothetical protein